MYIVHVVPISRGISSDVLSYFSSTDIESGAIVNVPLRSRTVPAMVLSSEKADDLKAELRSSSFPVRKISKIQGVSLFLPEFLKAVHATANYFAGSAGSVLAAITPKPILEQAEKIVWERKPRVVTPIDITDKAEPHEPYTLQADEEERIAHYKSLIREQFARKRSVLFCLPTIQDTKRIFETLPKGIEEYTFVINSSLSKKEMLETWNAILAEAHPILIIATGSFLSIPRPDIGTIIIERESASGYKTQTRPYVDIRTFAEFYAKEINAKLILGDVLLRTETVWRSRNSELAELAPLKFRSLSTAEASIVNMKKYKTLETPEFRILSDELQALIKSSRDHNEHIFIFAARRGLSPLTVCGDCGTTVLCHRCSAPITLHTDREEHFFMCHHCGERRSAEERCRHCGSWKLTTLGIGIELIEEAIKSIFPTSTIFRMDKDSIKTHKQALTMAEKFYNSPGSILIGTEMALGYLERPVDNSAIAAIDSLLSIPDFRINEKIMNIILRIRSITQKKLIVQTRTDDTRIFDYAIKGNLMDFYREEIEDRKRLSYPPFSTLIKLSIKGSGARVETDMNTIAEQLKDYDPLVFPAFIETVNKKRIIHALLKIERKNWVNQVLLQKLQAVPPYVAVNVDPENVL